MNMAASMTDCNKRKGLWQLSQRQSARAYDNVAGLHRLIAKLLIHFSYLVHHQNSKYACTSFIFTSRFHLGNRTLLHEPDCVFKRIRFGSWAVYNRGPITLPHLHMVRMNPNRSVSQPCQLLPSTTCHQDILQQYQRKHFGDCASCVLSSVSLN